jgi:hypothetical protein
LLKVAQAADDESMRLSLLSDGGLVEEFLEVRRRLAVWEARAAPLLAEVERRGIPAEEEFGSVTGWLIARTGEPPACFPRRWPTGAGWPTPTGHRPKPTGPGSSAGSTSPPRGEGWSAWTATSTPNPEGSSSPPSAHWPNLRRWTRRIDAPRHSGGPTPWSRSAAATWTQPTGPGWVGTAPTSPSPST